MQYVGPSKLPGLGKEVGKAAKSFQEAAKVMPPEPVLTCTGDRTCAALFMLSGFDSVSTLVQCAAYFVTSFRLMLTYTGIACRSLKTSSRVVLKEKKIRKRGRKELCCTIGRMTDTDLVLQPMS